MPKYNVFFSLDASVMVTVEAKNKTEARDIAQKKVDMPCLCHQCSREINLGDIDEITDIEEV